MNVTFAPEAEDQIAQLFRYLAKAASPDIAERYIESLIEYCESLVTFPHRGTIRDDLRPGLRMTHHRGKTAIAFSVLNNTVQILGIFHGSRNYEVLSRD